MIFIYSLVTLALTPLTGQHDTIKANEYLEEGIDLYYDGDYLQARTPLLKALQLRLQHYPVNHVKIEDMYYWLGANELDFRNNEKAIEYFLQGAEIAKKRVGAEDVIVADFYMDIGNAFDQAYRIDEAKVYFEKTLAIYRKAFGDESVEVGNALMNIGYGQRKMGNYQTTADYYKRAYAIFKKSAPPNSKEFYRIYVNQSNLLVDLGEYDRAMDFVKKALEIKLMHYDTMHPSVYKYFGNIGRLYQLQGEPEKALPYMQKSLEIATATRGAEHPETAGFMGEFSSIYEDLGQLEKALQLSLSSIKIQEKGLPPTHPYLIAGYDHIGELYKKKKDYDAALAFYETAIEKYQDAPSVPRHLLASTLGRIAEVIHLKGDTKEAIKVIQSGLVTLVADAEFDLNDVYDNPPLDGVEAEGELLFLLRSKAFYLLELYRQTGAQQDLMQAAATSQLAIELIERIRRSYSSEISQRRLNAETASVFGQAVEQAYLLYEITKEEDYVKKAFELSEKSKSSILQQSIRAQRALMTTEVPKELLDRIQTLEVSISKLENQRYSTVDEAAREALDNEIFDLQLQYEDLIISLEDTNPEYYRLKYAAGKIVPEFWQQKLKEQNLTLLEYFYHKDHLYIFTLQDSGLQMKRVLFENIESKIRNLRNYQSASMSFSQEAVRNYINSLNELYELLIAPVADQLKTPNLLIIPHGVLNYLSFESLCPPAETTKFNQLPYLLSKYNLQYHWSGELWAQPNSSRQEKMYSLLGFAPTFEASEEASGLAIERQAIALPHATTELRGANRYFDGKLFLDSEAKESTFYETAHKGTIVHLATHARVNDLQPLQSGFLFSAVNDSTADGFLSALEIYQMRMNADLAIMSACNTGYGQIAKGEGIMSLGRAFLYAGCKSLVSSLWLANDASTSEVIQRFYYHAAAGKTKDEALRSAKLDYLDTADPLRAHPYFWANLIAVGDMSPLQEETFSWLWYLLGGGVVVLLIFIFKRS